MPTAINVMDASIVMILNVYSSLRQKRVSTCGVSEPGLRVRKSGISTDVGSAMGQNQLHLMRLHARTVTVARICCVSTSFASNIAPKVARFCSFFPLWRGIFYFSLRK